MVDSDAFVDDRYPPGSPLFAPKLSLRPSFHLVEMKMSMKEKFSDNLHRSPMSWTIEKHRTAGELLHKKKSFNPASSVISDDSSSMHFFTRSATSILSLS